ncbi:hypothetical protein FRB91_001641 [Serendipita sp. 411]|nr:hypothetical protein FRB91_001641 [Serendipita sp. 411]
MGFPALGSSITELASQYRATQFTAVAVITLWAYDYLLTFADEVELVWKRRQFSWTKVLFSINRYLPVIHCFFVGMRKYAVLCVNATVRLDPTLIYTLKSQNHYQHDRYILDHYGSM